jgi:uncharacterized protein YycO
MSVPVFPVIAVHVSGFDRSRNQGCRLSADKINWIYSVGRGSSGTQALGYARGQMHPQRQRYSRNAMRRPSYRGTSARAQGLPRAFAADDIPLDPGSGGMSIGEDALMMGDIILSTTNSLTSRAIRAITDGPVSHAMVYIGDGMVVEAIPEGVVNRPLSDALSDAIVAVAFRHPYLDDDRAWQLRDWLGQQLGRSYPRLGMFRQAQFHINRRVCDLFSGSAREHCRHWRGFVDLGLSGDGTFFCSELVLAGYRHIQLPLADTPPHWSTPSDIPELRLTGDLEYVGHLIARPVGTTQTLGTGRQPYQRRGNGGAQRTALGLGGGAGAAVAGPIVNTVLSTLVDGRGDIEWTLEQLDGVKYPNDDPNQAGSGSFQDKQVTIEGPWVENLLGDRIQANFRVRWQYDGRALGNVEIVQVGTNDAAGWGLKVNANIVNDSRVYRATDGGGETFAAIRVNFSHHFSRWPLSDVIAHAYLMLYGNGAYDLQTEWTQE